jgi:hypothetical protein
MKKWIIGIGIGVVALGLILWAITVWQSVPLPEAEEGPAAEKLADKMLAAVDKEAWDSLGYIQWSFMGQADYVWDIQDHKVRVRWDDIEVLLDPDKISGKVMQSGDPVAGADAESYLNEAFERFCNDAFWLNAYTKVRDPGTTRGLVKKDGRDGLLVTYQSGGVTPGDSYLWWLDEAGRPESFQMWVSIIPVGGMEFTFEDWDTLYNGAEVARSHKNAVMNVELTNVEAAPTLDSLGLPSDMFDFFK